MTPAEKKARDAVVRAAKRWDAAGLSDLAIRSAALSLAVSRLQREEAKRKGVRRGK